jgi:aryl-alcohol dehydrogenase-like predicted oxidoreductase
MRVVCGEILGWSGICSIVFVFQYSSRSMHYKLLGRSTLRVSVAGFGCMSLGEGGPDTERLIHRAIEGGINLFDTADLYNKGLNEACIGRILQGKRDQVILATKVGNQWRADGSGWEWNPRKDYIVRALEDSLQRLRTDRIDLYQLHGGTIGDPIDETIGAFELLQRQGKIRYYGLSSIRPDVIREYIRRSGMVSVMMQYSLADRRPEESCLKELKAAGIGVLARGAVAKGLLAGKKAEGYLGHSAAEMAVAAERVREAAEARNGRGAVSGKGLERAVAERPARIAIRWVMDQEAVTSAVVGIRTMEQLEDAVAADGEERLTESEARVLQTALKEQRYEEHR